MPKDDAFAIPRFAHDLTLRINVIRLTACVTGNSSEVGEHSIPPESCEKCHSWAAGYADNLPDIVDGSCISAIRSQRAEVCHLAVLPDKERVYGGNAGGRIRNRIKIGLASYLSAFVDQPSSAVGTA